jgi:hypothetical protein
MSLASVRDLVANHIAVDRDAIARCHESLRHCNDYPLYEDIKFSLSVWPMQIVCTGRRRNKVRQTPCRMCTSYSRVRFDREIPKRKPCSHETHTAEKTTERQKDLLARGAGCSKLRSARAAMHVFRAEKSLSQRYVPAQP